MPGPNEVPYTQELADRICAALTDGASLRTICAWDGMPDRVNVWRWRRTNEEFASQYDAARKEGAYALVDDMTSISDDETLDPNDKRIRVDTRKWIASKVLPKLYGDKLAISGDEDGAPISVTWAVMTP